MQDHRLTTIETEINKINDKVQLVLERLSTHASAESNMQKRILAWVVSTLVGVIGTLLFIILSDYFK